MRPALILVRPTLAENIGIAARAAAAMGFEDFRLVAPQKGWVQQKALKAAAWAEGFLAKAPCFATLEEAVADLKGLVATSARRRAFNLPHLEAGELAKGFTPLGGILFGNEKSGLSNEEMSLCTAVTTIATAGDKSLNIAQAVLLYGYMLREASSKTPPLNTPNSQYTGKAANKQGNGSATNPPPATAQELAGLFGHLEGALEEANFFHPPQMKKATRQKLRAIFSRNNLRANEVRMLRGVISSLSQLK